MYASTLDFCGNKLKSFMGKVPSSIRRALQVIFSENRLNPFVHDKSKKGPSGISAFSTVEVTHGIDGLTAIVTGSVMVVFEPLFEVRKRLGVARSNVSAMSVNNVSAS